MVFAASSLPYVYAPASEEPVDPTVTIWMDTLLEASPGDEPPTVDHPIEAPPDLKNASLGWADAVADAAMFGVVGGSELSVHPASRAKGATKTNRFITPPGGLKVARRYPDPVLPTQPVRDFSPEAWASLTTSRLGLHSILS